MRRCLISAPAMVAPARRIAKKFGSSVRCLNISEIQNDTKPAQRNNRQGLADKVSVVHGVFEDIPEQDGSYDVVWSQDAILHSDPARPSAGLRSIGC